MSSSIRSSMTARGYHRPSKGWRCGGSQDCPFGPDHKGRCRSTESQCVPLLSKRRSKFRAGVLLVLVSFLSLTAILSSNSFLRFISPGPLSMGHSEVGACKDCHAAIGDSAISWIHKAIKLNSNNDDQMCLSCHEIGQSPFLAHSTSSANLTLKSNAESKLISSSDLDLGSTWKMSLAKKLNEFDAAGSDQVSCSSCHREHKGQLEPLDKISAEQCHSCHQVTFGDLETQHPEYSQFPHTAPTGIKFDHVSHLEKHFYEDEYFDIAPEGCQQCHAPDRSGEWMLSKNFEESCSSCHLNEILGGNRAGDKGVAFLAVPELDTDTLLAHGFNVGEWPDRADGNVTSFMAELLATESDITPGNLYDLSSLSRAELENVAKFAWSIK